MNLDKLKKRGERLFWRKASIGESDQCWIWQGQRNYKGYGIVNRAGRRYLAHRMAYALKHGIPVPHHSVVIRHNCDNPPCVNPNHLQAGTQADNLADMYARGRAVTGERHPRAKLANSAVVALRIEYARGDTSMSKLARKFGIALRTVHAIVHGKRYKDAVVFGARS